VQDPLRIAAHSFTGALGRAATRHWRSAISADRRRIASTNVYVGLRADKPPTRCGGNEAPCDRTADVRLPASPLCHPQAGGGGLRSRSYCCCKRATTVAMSTNLICVGRTSGSILSSSHVQPFGPLYGRIVTDRVSCSVGSVCSSRSNSSSISEASRRGLSSIVCLSSGFRLRWPVASSLWMRSATNRTPSQADGISKKKRSCLPRRHGARARSRGLALLWQFRLSGVLSDVSAFETG
jgi:hypothetical protein